MKRLKVSASIAAVCSAVLACSDVPSKEHVDLREVVAQKIQRGAPGESIGMAATVLGAISLADYPDGLAEGEMRVREVVLQPNAKIAGARA